MSKYIIRVTNIDAPAPVFFQRMDGKGKPVFTASQGFAKRFLTEDEAAGIRDELKNRTTAADGESTLFEVVNADGSELHANAENNSGEWKTRFRFVQTATGAACEFQMKKTPAGPVCRFSDMIGNMSRERSAADIGAASTMWVQAVGAWLLDQINKWEQKS